MKNHTLLSIRSCRCSGLILSVLTLALMLVITVSSGTTYGAAQTIPGIVESCRIITVTPDEMSFSGDVTSRGNCQNQAVCGWLDSTPLGSIMIGVDPQSPLTKDWDGGAASAELYIGDVISPTVATVLVSWPDRAGKGIYSSDSSVTAIVEVDGQTVWSKRALRKSTLQDYYAVQQPPVAFTFVVTQSMTHTLTFRVPPHTAWDVSEIMLELCPMPPLLKGYGYGPFRYCQDPNKGVFPTLDEIAADMPFLAHNSNGIRTYSSCEVQGKIPQLAQPYGLSVAIGVWLGRDLQANEREMTCAIELAHQYSNVDSVIVGNEVLLRSDLTEAQLLEYIERMKRAVEQPVTTAEIWSKLRQYPAVIDSVEYLMVHIYSWWDAWGGTNVGNPAEYIVNIYKQIQQEHSAKRVVIGETGWPSGGNSQFQAVPSLENQCRFYTDFLRLASEENVEFYYFDVFDEAWKKEPGGVGVHWGSGYGDRSAKHKMQSVLLSPWALNSASLCSDPGYIAYYLPMILAMGDGPLPTSMPAPIPSVTPTPTAQTFNVYTEYDVVTNHFFPTGWMGDVEDIGMYGCWPGDPHSGQTAIKVNYSAEKSQGKGWIGVYWQEPKTNWGNFQGGYNLTSAKRLTFWAKGARGGEKVEFSTGGIWPDLCAAFRNPDSLQPAVSSDIITLTDSWRQYTIDLRGKDLSNIIGGFAFVATACANPDGAIFYLDDIQFEYSGSSATPTPSPTPTGEYHVYVYSDKDAPGNRFWPTGFMGDTNDIRIDECWRQDVRSGSTAVRVCYDAAGSQGNNWAALAWVAPAENWGDRPGGYDLTGTQTLCFAAKGERGGEKIEFKMGGIGHNPETCALQTLACGVTVPYPDSVCPPVYKGVYTLTNGWQDYCLDLNSSVNLSHVVGGFLWGADRSRNLNGACFYLDNIRYVFNRAGTTPPTSTPTPTPTRTPTMTQTPTLTATPSPTLTPSSFYVYADRDSPANHFVPSGWMGDTGDITFDDGYIGAVCQGTTAIRVAYSAHGQNRWAGIYWQQPENNWGTVPNAGFDLQSYNTLTFCAKGEVGGERIEFGVGGVGRSLPSGCSPIEPYPDSACKASRWITLTNQWQQYTLDLSHATLSYVIGGFLWDTNRDQNPSGAVFYVDEIRFERK
jgi:exo-beta-1,3-glucanase (GH17 family)